MGRKRVFRKVLALLLTAVMCAALVPAPAMAAAQKKIKQITYYDKCPISGFEDYSAVEVEYEDPAKHDNLELFALKKVSSEEEAKNFGYDGFKIKGQWYKPVGLWTVPPSDIIDKGSGKRVLSTPLYTGDEKLKKGEKVSISIYDYDDKTLTEPVELTVPGEGGQVTVKPGDEPEPEPGCNHEGYERIYEDKGDAGHDVICSNCKEVIDTEAHKDTWEWDGEPGEDALTHHKECELCSHIYEDSTAPHVMNVVWDDNKHTHSCSICGMVSTDVHELMPYWNNRKHWAGCNVEGCDYLSKSPELHKKKISSITDSTHSVECTESFCDYGYDGVHFLRTRSIGGGQYEEYCPFCDYKKTIDTPEEKAFAEAPPTVENTEWNHEDPITEFPSVVKLFDSSGLEDPSLVVWTNDGFENKDEPAGEQKITEDMKTGSSEGVTTYEVPGKIDWGVGAEPIEGKTTVAVKGKIGGRTFIGDPVDLDKPSKAPNVALVRFVTSDGLKSASMAIRWPQEQKSLQYVPPIWDGFAVTPSDHSFTTNGEVFTFTYTPLSMFITEDETRSVTVNYTVPDGYSAPPSKTVTGRTDTPYAVYSPEISGLTASQRVVDGQFKYSDQTFTVTYRKNETTVVIDDKTVICPPDRVLVYNGAHQQGIPEHQGYTIEGGGSELFPGIYTRRLTLNPGWKWSDGTTGAKTVTFAIDLAKLSRIVLSSTRMVAGTLTRPEVVSVVANGMVVEPGNYTVTWSDPTSEQPGIYSVTATANGNTCYTGSVTATYSATEVQAPLCPNHGNETYFVSNRDGETHDEICKFCNAVIIRQEKCVFDQFFAAHVDDNKIPNGKMVCICSKCQQAKFDIECDHPAAQLGYKDNGDGTHQEYCKRCLKPFFNQGHVLTHRAVKNKLIYKGNYVDECTFCDFYEEKTCTHPKEEERVERTSNDTDHFHFIYCNFCQKFLRSDPCELNGRYPLDINRHSRFCTVCGGSVDVFTHDFKDSRKITKVEAIPRNFKSSKLANPLSGFYTYYDYRIYYTETCKQCKAVRTGHYIYHTNDTNGSLNYRKAFEQLVNMKPEDLRSIYDAATGDIGIWGYVLCNPLLSTLQPVLGLVGWDSLDYASLDFTQLLEWIGSTSDPGSQVTVFDSEGNFIEDRKVIGDYPGTPEWSVEPESDSRSSGLDSAGTEEIPDAGYVVDLSKHEKSYVGVRAEVIKGLEEGVHTIMTSGMLTNGERASTAVEFTVGKTGGGDTIITGAHPVGTAFDAEGGMIFMETGSDAVAYTGSAVAPPAVTVKKMAADGEDTTVLTPGTDYDLSYYRFSQNVGGELVQEQIQASDISGIGNYGVAAVPKGGSGWTGSVFANFRVARDLESCGAVIPEIPDQIYKGYEIEPPITLSANVSGEMKTLTRSNAWKAEEGEQGVVTYTQGDAGDYSVRYKDNIKTGTATVTVTGEGEWMGTLTGSFNITGDPEAEKRITDVTLSDTSFVWNGRVQVPQVVSVKAGEVELDASDYGVSYSDGESVLPGTYGVYATAEDGSGYKGTVYATYTIEALDSWNLFENAEEHKYYVDGISSSKTVNNTDKKSQTFFEASITGDEITVKLKNGADRKKAAKANQLVFDLGEEGSVAFTLPLTYSKPAFKLSTAKGTVKAGKEMTVGTGVLYKTENGVFAPFDLTGATVKYGTKEVTVGDDGQVSIASDKKASEKLTITKDGWNEKDPVALKFTISEVKADKDLISVDTGALKQVTLNTNAPDQVLSFPVTFNGDPATPDNVSLEGNGAVLGSIGDGKLDVSIGRSGTGKGSYKLILKGGNASVTVKVKVSDKALNTAVTGKIKQKYNVVTKQPMVVVPAFKDVYGDILEAKVTAPAGFDACVEGEGINVVWNGENEMKADNLKIGDMKIALTLEGVDDPVEIALSNVSAAKSSPGVKAGAAVIPKNAPEDGEKVISAVNIMCTYSDGSKKTHIINPADVQLDPLNVTADPSPEDKSRILIQKLEGKSGKIKATLTFPGGVKKTVTIKVSKGK